MITKEPGIALQQNLNALLEKSKVSLAELSRNTGIPLTTLKRIRSNSEPPNPTISTCAPLATFFNISIDQLIGLEPLNQNGEYLENQDFWQPIPLVSWEEASKAISEDTKLTASNMIMTDANINDSVFALTINNDNFIGFKKGETLVIDPKQQPNLDDYVIVLKKGEPITTLRVFVMKDNKPYLKPLSRYFGIEPIDDYQVVGTVIKLYKKHPKFEG